MIVTRSTYYALVPSVWMGLQHGTPEDARAEAVAAGHPEAEVYEWVLHDFRRCSCITCRNVIAAHNYLTIPCRHTP